MVENRFDLDQNGSGMYSAIITGAAEAIFRRTICRS
jgi:hypothetical protein